MQHSLELNKNLSTGKALRGLVRDSNHTCFPQSMDALLKFVRLELFTNLSIEIRSSGF